MQRSWSDGVVSEDAKRESRNAIEEAGSDAIEEAGGEDATPH